MEVDYLRSRRIGASVGRHRDRGRPAGTVGQDRNRIRRPRPEECAMGGLRRGPARPLLFELRGLVSERSLLPPEGGLLQRVLDIERRAAPALGDGGAKSRGERASHPPRASITPAHLALRGRERRGGGGALRIRAFPRGYPNPQPLRQGRASILGRPSPGRQRVRFRQAAPFLAPASGRGDLRLVSLPPPRRKRRPHRDERVPMGAAARNQEDVLHGRLRFRG